MIPTHKKQHPTIQYTLMSIPHHSTNTSALATLLTSGMTQSQAAATLGITPSAVSQLMSSESPELDAARKRSSALDAEYDEIEGALLKQLKRTIPLLLRPGEISNVLTRINAAKRRGVAADTPSGPTQVIQLNLPTRIQNKFVVNSTNQVVTAGDQDLVTIQSAAVQKLLESHNNAAPQIPLVEQEDEFGFTYPVSTANQG